MPILHEAQNRVDLGLFYNCREAVQALRVITPM